jgi:hypothetical protein
MLRSSFGIDHTTENHRKSDDFHMYGLYEVYHSAYAQRQFFTIDAIFHGLQNGIKLYWKICCARVLVLTTLLKIIGKVMIFICMVYMKSTIVHTPNVIFSP